MGPLAKVREYCIVRAWWHAVCECVPSATGWRWTRSFVSLCFGTELVCACLPTWWDGDGWGGHRANYPPALSNPSVSSFRRHTRPDASACHDNDFGPNVIYYSVDVALSSFLSETGNCCPPSHKSTQGPVFLFYYRQ
jgi:hypothetical protein